MKIRSLLLVLISGSNYECSTRPNYMGKQLININSYDLVVHIGQGKTGTTSIQRFLKRNAEHIGKQGIQYLDYYLETLIDNKIGQQIFRDVNKVPTKDSIIFKSLNSALETRKRNTTLLWSNESILKNKNVLEAILELRKDYKICVIAYVRNLDSLSVSAYSQWGIKHKTYRGVVKGYIDFCKTRFVYSSYSCLLQWEEVFGNDFFIRNFDAVEDALTDFLETLQIQTVEPKLENSKNNVNRLRKSFIYGHSITLLMKALFLRHFFGVF
ncbi:hypothetical protein HCZ91_13735 [Psychrobacter sp. BI730]|nr:hypothetical protein [Psychrobacter sp. BI730]